jgi:hypothetical protein
VQYSKAPPPDQVANQFNIRRFADALATFHGDELTAIH